MWLFIIAVCAFGRIAHVSLPYRSSFEHYNQRSQTHTFSSVLSSVKSPAAFRASFENEYIKRIFFNSIFSQCEIPLCIFHSRVCCVHNIMGFDWNWEFDRRQIESVDSNLPCLMPCTILILLPSFPPRINTTFGVVNIFSGSSSCSPLFFVGSPFRFPRISCHRI